MGGGTVLPVPVAGTGTGGEPALADDPGGAPIGPAALTVTGGLVATAAAAITTGCQVWVVLFQCSDCLTSQI